MSLGPILLQSKVDAETLGDPQVFLLSRSHDRGYRVAVYSHRRGFGVRDSMCELFEHGWGPT